MKKILNVEPGKVETFHYAPHDGTAAIQTETDVTKLLDANKFERSTQPMRHQSETFNKVASIDVNAAKLWCLQKGIKYGEFLNDPNVLRRFLNDPDNKAWRTREGRI